jgi:hypothetical protein
MRVSPRTTSRKPKAPRTCSTDHSPHSLTCTAWSACRRASSGKHLTTWRRQWRSVSCTLMSCASGRSMVIWHVRCHHGNALTRYPGPVYRTGPAFLMLLPAPLSPAPLHCRPLPPSRAMQRPGTSACRLGPETKRAAMHVAEGQGAQNGPGRTAGCQAFAAPASTSISIISREAR